MPFLHTKNVSQLDVLTAARRIFFFNIDDFKNSWQFKYLCFITEVRKLRRLSKIYLNF